jgi:hypothetical protein
MKFGGIKAKAESTIAAGQDQAFNTNYFKKKVQRK